MFSLRAREIWLHSNFSLALALLEEEEEENNIKFVRCYSPLTVWPVVFFSSSSSSRARATLAAAIVSPWPGAPHIQCPFYRRRRRRRRRTKARGIGGKNARREMIVSFFFSLSLSHYDYTLSLSMCQRESGGSSERTRHCYIYTSTLRASTTCALPGNRCKKREKEEEEK